MTTDTMDNFTPNHVVRARINDARLACDTYGQVIATVLRLSHGDWVCGQAFYGAYMPTYSQAISRLRANGEPIESAPCRIPGHIHKAPNQAAYRSLATDPTQPRLFDGIV